MVKTIVNRIKAHCYDGNLFMYFAQKVLLCQINNASYYPNNKLIQPSDNSIVNIKIEPKIYIVIIARNQDSGNNHQQNNEKQPANPALFCERYNDRENEVELKFYGNSPNRTGREIVRMSPSCCRVPGI